MSNKIKQSDSTFPNTSLMIKEFRKLQLDGFGSSPNSDYINTIINHDRAIFLNPQGAANLEKILSLFNNLLEKRLRMSPKRLESFFIDNFFNLLIDASVDDGTLTNNFNSFIVKIKSLSNKKATIVIPITGLVVKKDLKMLDYKIISKQKFQKLFKNFFSSRQLKEQFKVICEYGDSLAVIEDFGENKTLQEKHILGVDLSLNLLRLYIPHFWHHNYQVQISVANQRMHQHNSCYIFDSIDNVWGNRTVAVSQRLFEIDAKRSLKDKWTTRSTILKLNYKKLNFILLKGDEISILLSNSLKWIGLYTKEKDLNLKFLFLIFCLEALFSNEQSNYSSVAAAISEKVAFIINKNEADRIFTFNIVKSMYIKRSSIVHGSNYKIADEELLKLSRVVIQVFYGIADIIFLNNFERTQQLNEYFLALKFNSI